MALIQANFFAESLGMATEAVVILPQATTGQIGLQNQVRVKDGDTPCPVLYLLHGLSDDHTAWLRRTAIERYVAPMGLAVVMPNVHRSFYADMTHGGKYFTFVTEELPRLMRSFFRLSERREDTFVAGLSMGGYGAFRCALTHPDRYAAAASLSGALDRTTQRSTRSASIDASLALAFGDMDRYAGSDHDLLRLASEIVSRGDDRPALYQCCGTADFLYDQNRSFHAHCETIGLEVTHAWHAGQDHRWHYWDRQLRDVLGWLPLEAEPAD
ncbi:MAG: alpha/beta hydrolase family protein [Planctomycetota bacterium]